MTVTMLTGVVDDNTILSNQRVVDMDPVIAQLEPDEAPLVTLLMQVNKRAAFSQKVEWLEDELHPRYTTLSASYTSGTTIAVATGTGQYFKPGDVIRNELTGENMLVTGVATDTLTVTRGVGSIASTSSSGSADGIVRTAYAAAEGATLGQLKQTKKVAQYNYAQIVRTGFGMTNTLIASKLYGQSDVLGYEANKKMIEHKRELENMFWLGRRSLDTSGAAPRAFCGGIQDYITTNVATGGAMAVKTFEQFLIGASGGGAASGPVARFGALNKAFFCAPILMGALSSYASNKLALPSPDQKTFGVGLTTYRSANGYTLNIIAKRDWGDFARTGPYALGGAGFALTMDNIVMRPLRDTRLQPNRQANDEDSEKQEYLTETSLMVKQERTHAWLRGVTDWA